MVAGADSWSKTHSLRFERASMSAKSPGSLIDKPFRSQQYGLAKVTELEGGRFRIIVLITMPITQHLICSVSGFLLCLSRVFLIDYQWWGSVVQGKG